MRDKSKELFNVAVVGATGAVGEVMLELLASRQFPVDKVYALASNRSVGETVMMGDTALGVEDLDGFDFSDVDIALFSAGGDISAKYAPIAANAGCVVIDNTSCFRYQDDIPLIVPEVNLSALEGYERNNIIANPNCSTIQMLVALKPIYDAVGISRINVATYQSVSGAGREAIKELASQTAELLNGRTVKPKAFQEQIAFNVIPHIDAFQDNGYTKEEMKMVWETQKIFGDKEIQVNPTAVRVPVFFGHSEAIHVETKKKISRDDTIKLLKKAPGIKVVDDEKWRYPTAHRSASGKDPVFVGRIREDISHPMGINLWVVADNVRKGAALNALQIAEAIIK